MDLIDCCFRQHSINRCHGNFDAAAEDSERRTVSATKLHILYQSMENAAACSRKSIFMHEIVLHIHCTFNRVATKGKLRNQLVRNTRMQHCMHQSIWVIVQFIVLDVLLRFCVYKETAHTHTSIVFAGIKCETIDVPGAKRNNDIAGTQRTRQRNGNSWKANNRHKCSPKLKTTNKLHAMNTMMSFRFEPEPRNTVYTFCH